MPTTVLIVEDDSQLTKSLSSVLREKAFVVTVVGCPCDAIKKLQTFSFDLILLDLLFPTTTGYTVIDYLQATDTHTKVLMMSQLCQCTERVKALKNGADDFISKPFYPEELLLKIEKLVQRKHGARSQWIHTKYFDIDVYAGKVIIENNPIQLRRKEFEILTLLIRHKNMILTKDVILEHVWNTDTMPMIATVDVHIRRIRLQIGDYDKEVIKTAYGNGYMFVE